MTLDRHGEAGVTLIEVLVSLAIFAVIGIAGLTVLDTVARTGERTDGRLERLAEIDRAFLVIRRDLAQISGLDTQLNEEGLAFRRLDADGSFAVRYFSEDVDLNRQVRRTDRQGWISFYSRVCGMCAGVCWTHPSAGHLFGPLKVSRRRSAAGG